MIDALLLDLDDTLVDRGAALSDWLRTILPAAHQASATLDTLVALDGGGHAARTPFFRQLARLTCLAESVVRRRFLAELPELIRVRSDADCLLQRFRGRTVVVTNGPEALQRAKLRAAMLAERIDVVVTADTIGVRKPSLRIFQHALSRVGCRPECALMVGDHPWADVAGAERAGISGVLLRTRWFEVPDRMRAVDRLTELVW